MFLGQYLFIESSYPRLIHETAIVRSETIAVSGRGKCVHFWFHMYGNDIGSLEINMRVGFAISETIVWKLTGAQGNKWIQGQAPLISRGQNIEVGTFNIAACIVCYIMLGKFLSISVPMFTTPDPHCA